MNKISVVILTYNEEKFIEGCLQSVLWADEIVIVDSYSSDNTLAICRKYTDNIRQQTFIDFSTQRNVGIERATNNWVLMLDADERITDYLAKEIQTKINKVTTNTVCFAIPRKNYFLGKWIKHCGWYPDYTPRIFLKDQGRYSGQVHEHLNVNGNTIKLYEPLIHYTLDNISQYVLKTEKYTNLAVQEMREKGKTFKITDLLFRPPFRFIKTLILKQGYRDGIHGLVISILAATSVALKYAKLWQEGRNKNSES